MTPAAARAGVVSQGDITELKDLTHRLNAKYETEQKRLRQLQEDIVLSNARAAQRQFPK